MDAAKNKLAIKIVALARAPRLRAELLDASSGVLGRAAVERGEDLVPTIDRLLKASKLDPTNVVDITVICEEGASQLSCQMAKVARETFLFAQSAIKSTNIHPVSSK